MKIRLPGAFILIACAMLTACGPDSAINVLCDSPEDVMQIIGEQYLFPGTSGLAPDYNMQFYYTSIRDCDRRDKAKHANGYEIELTSKEDVKPFQSVKLRGREETAEIEYWDSWAYQNCIVDFEEELSTDGLEILYQALSYPRVTPLEYADYVYAACTLDGIRYSVTIAAGPMGIYHEAAKEAIQNYFTKLASAEI